MKTLRRFTTLILLLALVIISVSCLPGKTLEWDGEPVCLTTGIKAAGFPSFNILPNGSWVMTYKDVANDPWGNIQAGKGEIYLKRSTDRINWSAPYKLFGDNATTPYMQRFNYDGAEIIPMPNNSVWAISSKVPSHSLVYKVSDFNTANWTAEQVLPDVVSGGYPYALGNHAVRTGNSVFLPIYVWKDGSDNTSDIRAGVYFTSNSGATWQFNFFDPRGWNGIAGSEPGLAYLGNNSFLAIWRSIEGGQNVWVSRSLDGCLTWQTPFNIGTANGGPFPWLADIEFTWFGDTLVLTAMTNEKNDASAGLSAWASADKGFTWGNRVILIPETVGETGSYHGIESLNATSGYMVYNSPGGTSNNSTILGRKVKLSNSDMQIVISLNGTGSSMNGTISLGR